MPGKLFPALGIFVEAVKKMNEYDWYKNHPQTQRGFVDYLCCHVMGKHPLFFQNHILFLCNSEHRQDHI
jgi:hypothetical protein